MIGRAHLSARGREEVAGQAKLFGPVVWATQGKKGGRERGKGEAAGWAGGGVLGRVGKESDLGRARKIKERD